MSRDEWEFMTPDAQTRIYSLDIETESIFQAERYEIENARNGEPAADRHGAAAAPEDPGRQAWHCGGPLCAFFLHDMNGTTTVQRSVQQRV